MMHQRLLVFLAVFSSGLHGQWLNFQTPGTPRLPDGTPNLNAPVPRGLDGKPDLSGVWMHEPATAAEMKRVFGNRFEETVKVDVPGMELGTQHRYAFNILQDFKPQDSPMRPAAAELMKKASFARDPDALCSEIPGIPLADLLSEPIKIVQSPRLSVILYEAGNAHRQIYTDGRELPKEFSLPAYYGYSVGHWEGDTFVVESAGFNDTTSLDAAGHPHSEALHLVERYRRRDFGHLDVETTIDDPQMYTRPFTIRVPHNLLADGDVFESFCENEKDSAHLKKQ
jgi:hypothetical protein